MLEPGSHNTSLEICSLPKTRFAVRRSLPFRMSKRRGSKRKVGPRYPNGQLRHRHALDDPGLPTPQRFRHGAVARLDKPIADDEGRPARPYRAASFLSKLEDAGLIDAKMRAAGDDFRALFFMARFDPLGAAELARSSRSTGGTEADSRISRVEKARNAIWRAICAVGGLASLNGSVLWHVVGWECELERWALERGWIGRRISAEGAQDILISALASLKEHDL